MKKVNEREQKIYQVYAKVAGRKQSSCSTSHIPVSQSIRVP